MNARQEIPDGLAVPPHSIEMEQAVLGALLIDNDAIDRVGDLRAEHFYRYDHRLIFDCISKLIVSSRRADALTVLEWLRSSGKSEEVGGLAYLNNLAQNAMGSANIGRYAEIVIARWKLRGVISVADTMGADAFSPMGKSVNEIIGSAQEGLESLIDKGSKEPVFIGSFLTSIVERIDEEFHGSSTKTKALPTGLRDLDAKLGGGMRPGQLIIIAGRPAMGKAQPLDAKVRTFGGWARMGDLKIGERLASVDGTDSCVTGIFPQGIKRVSRVTFSDGRSTEACDEHLWSVHHRKWPVPKILSTGEVRDLFARPDMAGRLWVDSVSGDFGTDEHLPVDPWLLGALLGDGDFTQRTIRFSKGSAEILDRVRQSLPELVELTPAGGCDYRLSIPGYTRGVPDSNPLTSALSKLGLEGTNSHTKFIPEQYLVGSRETRLGILRGLLDTDGWVEKFGSVRFSSASHAIASGVQELARSLGFWCSMREKATAYVKDGVRHQCSTAHLLTISGHGLGELFLFSEKATRCADRTAGKRVAFKSIEPSREVECQCISVSHPSHLYVTDDYIVTHNTAIALSVAEAAAQEGAPTLVFSQEMEGEELCVRALSRASGLSLDKVLDGAKFGRASDDPDWSMLTAGVSKVSEMGLIVDDRAAISLGEIQSRARSVKRKNGLGLIVVDYLGLMAASEGDNRTQQVGANSRGLKALAKQMGVPVVLLAQLSRKCDERTDKRPMMADLRDSGEIEQDADIIIFLYRDEVYNPGSLDRGIAEINVAKQRNGPIGIVAAKYVGERTTFQDLVLGTKFGQRPEEKKTSRGFA